MFEFLKKFVQHLKCNEINTNNVNIEPYTKMLVMKD